jgi:predicted nucleic acid-binding protein
MQLKIELETKAKLFIQELLLQRKLDLVWSYMLDYENGNNCFYQKRIAIQKWQSLAVADIDETLEIVEISKKIQKSGLKPADSIHLACAICARCDYFITTDNQILKHKDERIAICDPILFLRIWEELTNDE